MNLLFISKKSLLADMFRYRIAETDSQLCVVHTAHEIETCLADFSVDIAIVYGEQSDSVAFIKQLRASDPQLPLLALADRTTYEYIKVCRDYGVNGLLSTNTNFQQLMEKAARILQGESIYDTYLLEEESTHLARVHFSRMERKVIDYIVADYPNKKIAQEMAIHEGTVRNYISNIYSKIGLHRRKEAKQLLKKWMEKDKEDSRTKR
ncbi:helix-turn-helix transcriptional regulator [Shouchella clausii]|uniref:helix-turn-helix transcriptional regulator n=1 Tax=Shouchella clausii TaxID=79880 RepID=UPI00115502DB|nr:LuxR C-terminal-related transcriptional regulator [Shouchella clausii]MEB5478398.1 LuxR C-terminal-related transcriptional regulator [Shouchella clausii]MED4158872.1 LuxR C-terminal-related transcriptional regulator [Shouchella clausii]MED4178618.1 LuxR C-terminal-related transcriptional regulator [Shouchella clausii]